MPGIVGYFARGLADYSRTLTSERYAPLDQNEVPCAALTAKWKASVTFLVDRP